MYKLMIGMMFLFLRVDLVLNSREKNQGYQLLVKWNAFSDTTY